MFCLSFPYFLWYFVASIQYRSGVHNAKREGVGVWSTHALIRLSFCLPELVDILFLDKDDHTLRKMASLSELKCEIYRCLCGACTCRSSYGLLYRFGRGKFPDFNPTTKLTKFKYPRNLPTVWYSKDITTQTVKHVL